MLPGAMVPVSSDTSSNVAVYGADPRLVHVTSPPGATDACAGLNAKSTVSTLTCLAASDGGAARSRGGRPRHGEGARHRLWVHLAVELERARLLEGDGRVRSREATGLCPRHDDPGV